MQIHTHARMKRQALHNYICILQNLQTTLPHLSTEGPSTGRPQSGKASSHSTHTYAPTKHFHNHPPTHTPTQPHLSTGSLHWQAQAQEGLFTLNTHKYTHKTHTQPHTPTQPHLSTGSLHWQALAQEGPRRSACCCFLCVHL